MRDITHFIDGASVAGTSGRFADVFNPNTGEVQARVALATEGEVGKAVASAVRAQQTWALVNPQRRARVMFEFKRLVEANMDELAEMLSSEHGKVIADARGDVMRGLDVIEFACGIPHALKGEYTEGAGPGIDVYSMRQPLGVVAGITPFNFPAMIPMWMFGIAIAVGNSFILKPSEKDPSLPVRLGELMMEAGALSVFALQGMRDAAGELDHLQAALDVALRVGDDLAVLAREHLGHLVHIGFDEPLEVEHDAGAALRIDQRPGLLGPERRGHGQVYLARAGERHTGLHLADVGVEDVAVATAGAGDRSAVDEVGDVTHGRGFRP
jgi:acyl-CoA reductase-like NAD-dependent aldehyde dehydrogenase